MLWVVGKDDRLPRLTRQMNPAVWAYLQERSGVTRPTRTGWWLMRLELVDGVPAKVLGWPPR